MKINLSNSIFWFRKIITSLFKLTICFQLLILSLSLVGIISYLFSISLGLAVISHQVIFCWLLTGTGLAMYAWSRFRGLLFDGGFIQQTSVFHQLAFTTSAILSTVLAIKLSLSSTFLNSGDFSSFVRLTNQFTQFRGPWDFGAFPFEYISPDRIHLHRNSGPFYPQATHFIVAMVDQALNFNDLPKTTRLLTALLCFTVFPLLFVLVGQSIRRQSDISNLISLSFLFSILVSFDLISGLIPAAIGMTLTLFVLLLSMSQSSFRDRNMGIAIGCFLLIFVHPSAAASLCLIYSLTFVLKFPHSVLSNLISRIFEFRRGFLVSLPFLIFVLVAGTVTLTKQAARSIELWSSFHINYNFDATLGLDLLIRIWHFCLVNFALFGHLSIINVASVLIILLYVAIFGLNLRGRLRIPELLIAAIILSSSLGGASGWLSFAKIPSIFWYSTPLRVIHLWTILVFFRFCKGNESRNTSSRLLTIILLISSSAAYTIHLFAISK
jgi:hypothetical protein